MATYGWTGAAADGNFANPSNWNPIGVPGAGDTVTIAAGSGLIGAGGGAALSLTDATGVQLGASDGTSFTFGSGSAASTFANGGVFSLSGGADATVLVVGGASLELSGAGTVVLSDSLANSISAATPGATLTNGDNLIEGAGVIGGGGLSFVNNATVDATGVNSLTVVVGTAATVNSGVLEASGAGGLVLHGGVDNGATGQILALGGTVDLDGASIAGGTVASSGAGIVMVQGHQSATLDGSANTVAVSGVLDVADAATLTLLGSIANTGTIALQSSGDSTALVVGGATAGTVTLSGGGTLTMTDAVNVITGGVAGDTLVNEGTILSAGQLGDGTLVLVNQGTIDSIGVVNATVLTSGSGTITNAGLLEATGSAGLVLSGAVLANAGGTISAEGGNIYLGVAKAAGSTVQGGAVTTAGSYAVVVQGGAGGRLDGRVSAVANQGVVDVSAGGSLGLLGSIGNTGTIALHGASAAATLTVTGTVTLSGGGRILLSNASKNLISGSGTAALLVNDGNMISGAGVLGGGALSLVNAGTISAAGSSGLSLAFGSAGVLTNQGVLQALHGSVLSVGSGTTVQNAGGIVSAAGGLVSLGSPNGAAGGVAGGLLRSGAEGAFSVTARASGVLDGSSNALTLIGALADSGMLELRGSVLNEGTISVLNGGALEADSKTVTLNGPGQILLGDQSGNVLSAAMSGETIDNVANIIAGAGALGGGSLTLVNALHGTISATGTTNALLLSFAGGSISNAGLIDAAGSAGLAILNGTVVRNAGGVVAATGGNIILGQYGGAASGVTDGTLTSSNGYSFSVYDQSTGVLGRTGGLLTNDAFVSDAGIVDVLGTIRGPGTIALQAGGGTLVVDSTRVNLIGGGTISLDDAQNNVIIGAASSDLLYNGSDTIEGSGALGGGALTLLNSALIEQTGAGALTLDLGSTYQNTAKGTLLATGSGGLLAQTGTYTNIGLIEAQDGSHVTFGIGAVLTNVSAAGTLQGGTYVSVSQGNGAALSFTGAAVKVDSASLRLSGTAASISFAGVNVEDSLTNVAGGASLFVGGGADYASTLTLHNAGLVSLSNATLNVLELIDSSGGTLAGSGMLDGNFVSQGLISAGQAGLDLKGNVNLTGRVTGTSVSFDGGTSTLAPTSYDAGTLALINGATLNVAAKLSFGSAFTTLNIVGGALVKGSGPITLGRAATLEESGRGTASITAQVTNTGTILSVAGGALAFSGGLVNSGVIAVNGGFSDTAALAGGNLLVGPGGSSATIARAAGAGNSTVATLSIGGGVLTTSGTTLTVTSDYVNAASGSGNGYNRFAGVSGTIDGQGAQLGVLGVDGTEVSGSGGTLTIAVTAGQTAHFKIESTGAAGSADLRGALQTSVNGASITAASLSGSGVTPGDFGPIAAGGVSSVYEIAYSGGALTGQSIFLESDFANVPGVTLDIVAAPASGSPGRLAAHAPVGADGWLGMGHAL